MVGLIIFAALMWASKYTSHGKFNKKQAGAGRRGLVGPLVIVIAVLFLLAHGR